MLCWAEACSCCHFGFLSCGIFAVYNFTGWAFVLELRSSHCQGLILVVVGQVCRMLPSRDELPLLLPHQNRHRRRWNRFSTSSTSILFLRLIVETPHQRLPRHRLLGWRPLLEFFDRGGLQGHDERCVGIVAAVLWDARAGAKWFVPDLGRLRDVLSVAVPRLGDSVASRLHRVELVHERDDRAFLERAVVRHSDVALDSPRSVLVGGEAGQALHPGLLGLVRFASHEVLHAIAALVLLVFPYLAVLLVIFQNTFLACLLE